VQGLNVKGSAGVNLNQFRLVWMVFMVLATAAPAVRNFLATPAGFHYTWILPPYPEDSLGYMAWAQQAAQGHLLFQLKFTALEHSAFLFNPFFLIAGWMSRLFSGNIGFTLFAMKEVGVICFLAAFFNYIDYLGLNRFQSIAATVMVSISSGLGGLLAYFGFVDPSSNFSGDLWLVDMNTFWSLLWNPLFPYSLTLILLALFWLDRGSRDGCTADFWWSGLLSGILALIHPYSQSLLIAMAIILTVARRKSSALIYLSRYLLAALPFILYVGLVAARHPLLSMHASTGAMRSPPPLTYAIGFGLPLLFCALGMTAEREQLLRRCGQVILWFVISFGLAYFPFWFQWKLIFGAHIPLCIVAAISIELILNRISNSQTRRWFTAAGAVIFLPLLISTPAYLLASEDMAVRSGVNSSYYISNDVMDGLHFLKTRTHSHDVVFAKPATSSLIPGFAGNTVVWGHWAMSVDQMQRRKWIKGLFDERSDWANPARAVEFWGNDIQYIFADGSFMTILHQDRRKWQVILNKADEVFSNRSVAIYKHRSG